MPPKGKKPKRTNKPSPLDRMKEAFALVNLDEDQEISFEEFRAAMETIGVSDSVAKQLFDRFDPDGNGQLDKTEFFSYAAKGSGEVRAILRRGLVERAEEMDPVVEVFQRWDKDGDGTISKDELERVLIILNPSFTKKELNGVLKAADKNGDGHIDYQEFADWLHDSMGPGARK
mmetsp:Transcript_19387/g.42346  ORF Transcript_19387/g.42346 Transcript_19387/m.42346 type:complete len:174 (+) Transcript_19387:105-626(+)|eukprot:CAMPEP_0170581772 /NCGR_PEP_ID=MMETSP0224-20130122/7221_1 /TAXON_ID=285029 /ORGANISM="Togula jolla, Strain CCCM 725" /LENGTH=173 /DNA_ID=CAMNT_0010904937 /DNA_START=112 /DNA_END=633 /DNA_ORIENTATION=+